MRRHIALENEEVVNLEDQPVLSLEEEQVVASEVANTEAEIATDLGETDRVLEVSDALEDLAVVADGITEATPAETALMEVAGNMAVAGSDIEAEEIVPSMESFRGTRISTEGLRETAATMWKNILEFLKKVWAKIEAFFYKIFGLVPGLRRRVASLEKSVDEATGLKLENNKFKVTSGVAALCVDYKPIKNEAELKAGLKDLREAADFIYKTKLSGDAKAGEKMADIIGDFDPEKDAAAQVTEMVKAVGAHIKASANVPGSSTAPSGYTGFAVKAGAQLMGNTRLVSKLYNEQGDKSVLGALDRVRHSGVEFATAREKAGTIPGDFEFATLSLAGCSAILKDVENLLDSVEEYKRGKSSKEVAAAKKKMETASEKAGKAFEKSGNGEPDSKERAAMPYYKGLLNMNAAFVRWVQQPAVPFTRHALTAASAALMVVQKSVAQYK